MRIAVYCSAASELPERWHNDAAALGSWIGRNGDELVYGGVEAGLMKTVANATAAAGGRVTGVVPSRRAHMAGRQLTTHIRTSDLSERKRIMLNLADVFVALPGGYGTLDEVATTFAHLNFTGRRTPVILCNSDGVFTPLLEQFQTMIKLGLMRPEMLRKLLVTDNIDEVIQILDKLKKTDRQ